MLDLWQRIDLSEFLNSDKAGFLGGETADVERDATRRRATCDCTLICQRYDRIAPFSALFDWALFLPSGLRDPAADRLKLRQGDRVLEVGCRKGDAADYTSVEPFDGVLFSFSYNRTNPNGCFNTRGCKGNIWTGRGAYPAVSGG
jgi:hypothetical protein